MLGSITYFSISKFYIVHLSFTSEEVKKEILNIALALIELDRSYTIPTGIIILSGR